MRRRMSRNILLLVIALLFPISSVSAYSQENASIPDKNTQYEISSNGSGPPENSIGFSSAAIATFDAVQIKTPSQLSGGALHSLALDETGQVWAWGYNWYGSVGIGNNNPEVIKAPRRVEGLGEAAAIAAGQAHSLALAADHKSVWSWGYNSTGQLGDGTTATRLSPVLVQGLPSPESESNEIVAVAAGMQHSMALTRGGNVLTWGSNQNGQLGDGTTTNSLTPVSVVKNDDSVLSDIVAITASWHYCMALSSNGDVYAWGFGGFGQLGVGGGAMVKKARLVPDLTDIVEIAAGDSFSLALKSDGTLWASGKNDYGQLGEADAVNRISFARISVIDGIESIAAGAHHALALKAGGSLYAWGNNSNGQVGDGTTDKASSPKQVASGMEAIGAGGSHSMSLKDSGELWTWGSNDQGQLGDGTTIQSDVPKPIQEYSLHDPEFFKANGTDILDPSGNKFLIRGIGLGNNAWRHWQTGENLEIPFKHVNENNYKEIADLGFNSIRFYLNYSFLEEEDNPYHYREDGFAWLDDNIKWAKANGITLILNMHIPHLDFGGKALWTNEDNARDRQIALWKEIARRYQDNPTVMGYGILNEPALKWETSNAATLENWRIYAQSVVDEIREVDQNHIIFIEKPNRAHKGTGETVFKLNGNDLNYVPIEDACENLAYEFHFYDSFSLTGISMDDGQTANPFFKYPNDWMAMQSHFSISNPIRISGSVATKTLQNDDWELVQSGRITIKEETHGNVGFVVLNVSNLGQDGTAYFDDVKVTVYDESGNFVEDILLIDFNAFKGPWTAYSDNSYKDVATLPKMGKNGTYCMAVKVNSGATAFMVFDPHPIRFILKNGYQYQVSAQVKLENCSPNAAAYPRFSCWRTEDVGAFNNDFLKSELRAYKEKIESFGLPVYIGELGASYPGLERGGYQWVDDVIAACNELGMGYSYHLYSGFPFGLHNVKQTITPIPKSPATYKSDLGAVFERQVQIYKGQPFPVIIDEQP